MTISIISNDKDRLLLEQSILENFEGLENFEIEELLIDYKLQIEESLSSQLLSEERYQMKTIKQFLNSFPCRSSS